MTASKIANESSTQNTSIRKVFFQKLNAQSLSRISHVYTLMSRGMIFPTMWNVRPAEPQISLRICTVWSAPLLVAWIFYDC